MLKEGKRGNINWKHVDFKILNWYLNEFDDKFGRCNDKSLLLTESGNLYDGIEDDIDKILTILIDVIKTKKFGEYYRYKFRSGNINCGIIEIGIFPSNRDVEAECFVDRGIIRLTLTMRPIFRNVGFDELFEYLYDSVEDALVHELTHAIGDSFRGGTKTYKWYDIALQYLRDNNYNVNDICFLFFSSLYLTETSEVQAFLGQCTFLVEREIQNCKDWDNKGKQEKIEFIDKCFQENMYVKRYNEIYVNYLPQLRQVDDVEKERIINYLKQNGYTITKNSFEKFVKQIAIGCEQFRKKIQRGKNYLYNNYGVI